MATKLFNLSGCAGNIKGKQRSGFSALLGVICLAAVFALVLAGCLTLKEIARIDQQNYLILHARIDQTTYAQGQDVDFAKSGIRIEIMYQNPYDPPKQVSLPERDYRVWVEGYNKDKPGGQEVTVVFEATVSVIRFEDYQAGMEDKLTPVTIRKTTECIVTVVPVSRITVEQLPATITYRQDQDFNPSGLLVRAEYEGEAFPAETIELDRLRFSGYDKNRTGVQTITVDYYGNIDTFDVMVRPK
jgi:hypothetical protein